MLADFVCNLIGLSLLVFLGGIAKVNSILAMVLRNANQTFLTPLPVMDLKSPHLVIALRNANNSLLPELD
jgi:hypothetical protein